MRSILAISMLLASVTIDSQAQNQFDQEKFSQWFFDHSQTELLFQDDALLYIFSQNAKVRSSPYAQADIITNLNMGQVVNNIAYGDSYLPRDVINGYGDLWYHVQGVDVEGRSFQGFIWGADIAKAWLTTDLDGDRRKEFVLLGISSQTRTKPNDIKAEIRMIKDGNMHFRQTIPGLCLFQDCATSSLLRMVADHGKRGMRVLEATTMAIGCDGGIEKMLMIWNGLEFETVFHSELLSGEEYINKEFVFTPPTLTERAGIQICQFSHIDKAFNPVWECRQIEVNTSASTTTAKAKPKPKA